MPAAEWTLQSECYKQDIDPDLMFSDVHTMRAIRSRVCVICPVADSCLMEGMVQETGYGLFGGLLPRERNRLRKAYPKNTDWAAVIKELQKAPYHFTGILVPLYLTQKAGIFSLNNSSPSPKDEEGNPISLKKAS